MGLVRFPSQPDPRVAGWLDDTNSTPLRRKLIERSALDDGILEVPPGSNRGGRIDTYTKRSGAPFGSYWCAIMVGIWCIDIGLLVPAGFPSCDAWIPYMGGTRAPGSIVLYGVPGDARHIGLVTRVDPMVLTREGNRGLVGSNTNNGIICDQAAMSRRDVLGYVQPERLLPPSGRGKLRGLVQPRGFGLIQADE